MPKIEVKQVTINFPLYHENTHQLHKMSHLFQSGRLKNYGNHKLYVQGLMNISFTIQAGERVGLIGSNGAGKTTLLRTLAGIYEPITGHIKIEGRISSLLDPLVGLMNELTGKENIYLKCKIQGYNSAQTKEVEKNVREFSALEDYLDLPIRTYSSGMKLRLGFALATAILPQILMMDEWFLAGDKNFIDKANNRIDQIINQSEIFIVSSHNLNLMSKWCNRILWIEQGLLKMDGPPKEILPLYLNKPYEEICSQKK